MHIVKQSLHTLCDLLILVAVGGLIVPPFSYGNNASSPTAQGAGSDNPGQGDEHRADPCDHLPDPPGKAKGIDKHCPQAGSSSGIAKGDFNGDGFADLAIGVPGKDSPSTVANSGAVIVIYGSTNGLVSPTSAGAIPQIQFWAQNSSNVPDASEAGDHFGSALASGDFNGDGFSDLAIGAPDELKVVSGIGAEGAVTIIYGSPTGLNTDPTTRRRAPQQWLLPLLNQPGDLSNFSAATEADIPRNISHFGAALAWGDFDGDGFGDLAIGAPDTIIDFGLFGQPHAGAVGILFGGPDGLSATGSQLIHRPFELLSPSRTPVEDGNSFGASLAAGDFQNDGFSDLAVGIPNQNIEIRPGLFLIGKALNAGMVQIFNGSRTGVHSSADLQLLECGTCEPLNSAGELAGVLFGAALAAGDFDSDHRSDLAVGGPDAPVNMQAGAGDVVVFFGDLTLFGSSRSFQTWTQTRIFGPSDLFQGTFSEAGDRFGFSLAAGDFNNDGRDDLAIGVPFEDFLAFIGGSLVSVRNAGEVDVLYGASDGLSIDAHPPNAWRENTSGIGLTPQEGDKFGHSLTAWNFGKNETISNPPLFLTLKTADLAIGIPFKNVGSASHAGAVSVLYGSAFGNPNGLHSTNSQVWTENSPGMPTSAVTGDHFGLSLY